MQVRLQINHTGGWASGRGAAVGLISSRIIWDGDQMIGTVSMLQELMWCIRSAWLAADCLQLSFFVPR